MSFGNFAVLIICCECRFPIQIISEIFILSVKRHLQWCAPLWRTSSLCQTILLILLSHKDYLTNLHEIFRRHRYGPLPYLQVHHYHGYQSVLFLWQHNCNTLWNLLIYCNITQKLFNQSSWNFQGKQILSSPSLPIALLLWVSTNVVSIATYLQYSVNFLVFLFHLR